MVEIFSLSDLLAKEVECCFCCGDEKYCQFYVKDTIYRICARCLKNKEIIKFFKNFWDIDLSKQDR